MNNLKTILFVDDEAPVLSSIRRAFIDEPYNCLFATSAKCALELLATNTIQLLVSDICMPGIDGFTLLQIVKEQYPSVIQIVLSGNPIVIANISKSTDISPSKVLGKPWELGELKDAIREALKNDSMHSTSQTLSA